ncbi:unnamed protein product, partial [Gulo gulo]
PPPTREPAWVRPKTRRGFATDQKLTVLIIINVDDPKLNRWSSWSLQLTLWNGMYMDK